MDIRHPLREFDEMMLQWSESANMPLHILLTKADKLKRGARNNTLFKTREALPGSVTIQLFSSTDRIGLERLTSLMSAWLEDYGPENQGPEGQ